MAPRTVLISIRQAPLLDQIREFLQGVGYAVVAATSDDDTLQVLNRIPQDVDLLLADTPVADAPGLARTAVTSRPGLKVLLISGDPDYVNRELMPEAAIGFIEKPFAWCSLGRTVADLLASPATDLSCSATPANGGGYAAGSQAVLPAC
jgi:DNA-binding NtrC family response regulator